jgi:hypothetical protein
MLSSVRRVGAPLILALVLLLGGAPFGGPVYGQEVGVGAFSRLGFSARGIALGNALVATPTSDVSPYYNPALLPNASQQRLSATAALLSRDRQLQSLEFATPLGPSAGASIGLIHGGVGNIDGRNADGVHTETLSTDEFALSLSFGNRFLERLSVGVSLTLYQSDIVPDTSPTRGFGLDGGVAYRVTSQFKLAASVHDLLAKYEWNTGSLNGQSRSDRFPVRVRVGGSYTLRDGRVRLLGELESRYVARDRQVVDRIVPTSAGPRRETRTESVLLQSFRGRLGVAYRPVDILTLRAGLDRVGVAGTDGLKPGAGFGLEQAVGELDLRLSYGATLEPYVRSLMHVGTLEVFL